MDDAPRILAKAMSPENALKALAEKGIVMSEQTLRRRAKNLGAYKKLGRAIFFLPEDLKLIACKGVADDCLRYLYKNAHQLGHGAVYFVQDGEYVKIGHTTNFKKRIVTLQAGNPRVLETIGLVFGGQKFENFLHDRFRRYRLRQKSEWFEYSQEIQDTAEALINSEYGSKYEHTDDMEIYAE